MSQLPIVFIVVALCFFAVDIAIAALSFKRGGVIGKTLGVSCVCCASVVMTYLLGGLSENAFVHSCLTSVHYMSVNAMIVFITFFVGQLVNVKKTLFVSGFCWGMVLLAIFDFGCLAINPFKEIVMGFVPVDSGFNKFDLIPHNLFYAHLAFGFVLVGISAALLARKCLVEPKPYRRRYRYALLGLLAVETFNILSEVFPGFLKSGRLDYTALACTTAAIAFYWAAFLFTTKRYVYDHRVPLENRVFMVFLVVGFIGSTCGLLICLATSVQMIAILVIIGFLVGMLLAYFVSRRLGYENLGFGVLVSGILFAMPIIWLSAGGVNGGVNCWFVYEFFYIAFVLKGKQLYAAMTAAFLLDGATYIYGYYNPDRVFVFQNVLDTYISTMASTFVVGLTIIVTVLYQKDIYYDEQATLEKAYDEQNRLKLEAEKANNAKSDFLASMSHEIRTPINAILGMDEMILRGGTPDEIREYAKNIKQAGNMLLSLVNDVLDFSKIERGKMNVVPVEYRLSAVVNDLALMIVPRAKERSLEFKTEIAEGIPSVLFGDDFRLRQVITNLLTNAVKYTSKGSVTLKIGYKNTNGKCCLFVSVKDTGIGIREEDRERLFDSFRRLDETRNRGIEGTGLGLSITQKLLELMGSSLQLKSEYGVGSEFYFVLEQGIVDAKPIGNLEQSLSDANLEDEPREKFDAPDAKILVVDDNRMNLLVVKGLLKDSKVQLDTAESGMECLEKVKENSYHIILMDHMMPQMDGIETLKRMREMPDNKSAKAKVVALTANAVNGAREMYLANGFDDFMSKPVRGYLLEKLVQRYLPQELVTRENPVESVPENGSPLIDFVKGEILCDHNRSLYREVLLALPAEHFDYYLQEYFEKSDWKNYLVKIHALKSSLASVGAEKTSKWAAKLEKATMEGDVKTVFLEHKELMAELQTVLAEIKAYCV